MPDTDTAPAPPSLLPGHLASRLAQLHGRLEVARPLPPEAVANLTEQYRLEATYHTNAIEGNTLTLPETRLVLERGLTVGGKPLAHHLEAVNSGAAWDKLDELVRADRPLEELLSHVTLQELHAVVMAGLTPDAGRYRTVNVRIAGSRHSPPDWSRVLARMMAVLVEARVALDSEGGEIDPGKLIGAVARFHHGLEAVHPFSDGNGRVGRLALNLLLLKADYPPLILRVDQRAAYYRALARADAGDLKPLALLLGKAAQESLVRHLGVLGGEEALLPLKELIRAAQTAPTGGPYSADYLALRARQGKLAATKLSGVWHSSLAALNYYMEAIGRIDKRMGAGPGG